jgi:cellulose 1,4-beta-cellobiosidase
MFYLLIKELSFEVDVSACGCGMNSALYFITMETDGGQASSGYTEANYGTARNGILRCPAASARPSVL